MEVEEVDMLESLVSLLVVEGREGGEAGFSGMVGAVSSEDVSLPGSSSGRVGRVLAAIRGDFSIEFASISGSFVAEGELGRVNSATFGVTWEL